MSNLLDIYPKIGIRPVLEGRMGGLRESLENQTMNMAKSVAALITGIIKYPNGKPIECVISDKSIGGVVEAAIADEKFEKENVGVTLSVTPSWCYGSETMDMHPHRPKAIWGFNGTERPGAVYLAAVLAAHNQKGIPAFGIYGKNVQDLNDTSIPYDVKEKILLFVKSAIAASIMKGKSYLSIGNVSMGIAGSIVDPNFFEDYLGMRCEYIDMTEIKRRVDLEIYDPKEYQKAIKWIEENLKEGSDDNPISKQRSRKQKDDDWKFVVKMTLISKDLMVGNSKLSQLGYYEESLGHNAIAAGFQGQRQWSDYYPTGDFTETILNSSFDWNGARNPYIFATENDSLNAVSMLFGYLVTNTAQIFVDVRTYWSPEAVSRVTGFELSGSEENGFIHLLNSGSACLDGTGEMMIDTKPAMKPFWEVTENEIKNCINSTLFRPVDLGYFRGGGYSTDYLTKGQMQVTMSRINIIKGLGPVLQIAEGHTASIPGEIHNILDKRTNPTWPSTWFVPRLTGKGAFTDVYSVMNNWGANHGAISYGHIGAELIALASILRIPVCMHNIEKDKIFRPSYWNSFGTEYLEIADNRACKTLGPLYGKNK